MWVASSVLMRLVVHESLVNPHSKRDIMLRKLVGGFKLSWSLGLGTRDPVEQYGGVVACVGCGSLDSISAESSFLSSPDLFPDGRR